MKHLNDTELLEKIKTLVKTEREATYEVLLHLREVERRMLFARLGYSSLFTYAMKELNYSEDESARRISAMRLLREVPNIENEIKSGVLSLSNLSQARSFFKTHGVKNVEEKQIILQKLENKSRREGENILASLPMSGIVQPKKEACVVQITDDLKQKLEMVRKVLGLGAELSYEELIHKMADAIFTHTPPPAPARVNKVVHSTTRYIAKPVREAVYIRDQGRCTYISKITGQRCGETKHLQYEHHKPHALGGENSTENLALLCSAHNSLRAVNCFGEKRMGKFMPALQA